MYDKAIVIYFLIIEGTKQHRKHIFFKPSKSIEKNEET